MCWIVGFIVKRQPVVLLVECLSKLEYRVYIIQADDVICILEEPEIIVVRLKEL